MLRKLLPVLLSLAAFIGGAAGGEMLRRPAAPAEAAAGAPEQGHDATAASPDTAKGGAEHAELPASAQDSPQADHAAPAGHGGTGAEGGTAGGHGASGDVPAIAWFEFPQQFLVPVLHDGRLDSTMILSLSLEMPGTARETVHAHEIKLRDALLRQLLIHANTGGFDGNFTSEAHLRKLRADLTAVAQGVIPGITAVLIGAIGRQER